MKILQGGLEIPTFLMSIMKEGDGPYKASMMRDDEEMFPSIVLDTAASIDMSKLMQWASIVVEGVLLVLSAIGISLSPGKLFSTQTHKKLCISICYTSEFQTILNFHALQISFDITSKLSGCLLCSCHWETCFLVWVRRFHPLDTAWLMTAFSFWTQLLLGAALVEFCMHGRMQRGANAKEPLM